MAKLLQIDGGHGMKRLLYVLLTLAWATPVAAQTSTFAIPADSLMAPVVLFPASAVNGAGVVTSPQLLAPNGTSALPPYSFAGDPQTGFYSGISTGYIGITNNNTITAYLRPDGWQIVKGMRGAGGNIWWSPTAPTATTFCTSPSIPANNDTLAFTVNVGTACATSVGTITLPAAATGWVVTCHNVTAPATNIVEQTGGTTTTATVTNYVRTTGVAGNWTDGNILRCTATAY